MDTIYGYFSVPVKDTHIRGRKVKNSGKGYVCIRVERPPKDSEDYTYTATLSFCSPLDQFSKKLGRRIADSRMIYARTSNGSRPKPNPVLTVHFSERPKMQDVFNAVLKKARDMEIKPGTPFMPRWFAQSRQSEIRYGLRTR